MAGAKAETRVVIFFRKGMFYLLELPVSDDIAKHAEMNPGTLRVEDTKGHVLWPLDSRQDRIRPMMG